jgi:hypothetical protein
MPCYPHPDPTIPARRYAHATARGPRYVVQAQPCTPPRCLAPRRTGHCAPSVRRGGLGARGRRGGLGTLPASLGGGGWRRSDAPVALAASISSAVAKFTKSLRPVTGGHCRLCSACARTHARTDGRGSLDSCEGGSGGRGLRCARIAARAPARRSDVPRRALGSVAPLALPWPRPV